MEATRRARGLLEVGGNSGFVCLTPEPREGATAWYTGEEEGEGKGRLRVGEGEGKGGFQFVGWEGITDNIPRTTHIPTESVALPSELWHQSVHQTRALDESIDPSFSLG